MSAIEQFISGLVDERLDRGVRAVSWLLGCAYVLGKAWAPSYTIDPTTAIEASAIIGAFRGLYVLWMRYVSKSHRLQALHGLINKCHTLVASHRAADSESLVSILVLRDELAKLALGLPKHDVLGALQSLQTYSQERRWDLANKEFPIARYRHTKHDKLEAIASIAARRAHEVTTQNATRARVISELKTHEDAMARERLVWMTVATFFAAILTTLAVTADRWLAVLNLTDLTQYLAILSGALVGVAYAVAVRRFRLRVSRRTLERALDEKTNNQPLD